MSTAKAETRTDPAVRLRRDVHKEAKLEATRRGLSMSDYVSDVLRKALGLRKPA